MVAVVDDRQARFYLNSIAEKLSKLGINLTIFMQILMELKISIKKAMSLFQQFHKAKGNEAFYGICSWS